VIANSTVEMAVTQLGGHMAPVTFSRGLKPFQLYHVSPWQGGDLPVPPPSAVTRFYPFRKKSARCRFRPVPATSAWPAPASSATRATANTRRFSRVADFPASTRRRRAC